MKTNYTSTTKKVRVALVYNFANLFNALLSRKQQDSCISLIIQYAAICCSDWSILRKSSLMQIHSWKRKEYSDSLFRCFRIFFFRLDSISSDFLEVSCYIESQAISISFSYSFTLKPTGLSCILNGSFAYAWFSYIMHRSFENIDSLSYAGLPNVDTIHHAIQNNHTLNATIDSSEKVF